MASTGDIIVDVRERRDGVVIEISYETSREA